MKIVNRETFLALPAGTLYATYQPCIFGDLMIKDESVEDASGKPIDFWKQELIPWFETSRDSGAWIDALTSIEAGGQSPVFDFDYPSRDGLFEESQLFAVFEKRDVEALLARLNQALVDGYSAVDG